MKKAITILLALVMVLSLVACGGNQQAVPAQTTENSSEKKEDTTESATIPSEPESIVLKMNEKHEFEKFSFTITGFEYSERFDNPVEGLWDMGKVDGKVYVILHYSVQYKDKNTVLMSFFRPQTLDFDNGYKYSLSEGPFFYDASTKKWHQPTSSDRLNDRSPEISLIAAFNVDDYVMLEKDKSLVVSFSVGGEDFCFIPSSNER